MALLARKLCKSVEKQKVLYDRSVADLASKVDVENAWDLVAAECNETAQSAKARWRSIRKVFMRSVGRTAAQQRKTRSREYYLYEELKFLLPHLNKSTDDSEGEVILNSRNDNITDDSNESSNNTVTATGSASRGTPTQGEKRKRESRLALTSSIKSSNLQATTQNQQGDIPKNNHVLEEPIMDGALSVRYRNAGRESNHNSVVTEQSDLHDPLQVTSASRRSGSQPKLQRTRSKSLYLERPPKNMINDESSDSDVDYSPPPHKKIAVSLPKEVIFTRTRSASKVQTIDGSDIKSKDFIVEKKVNPKNLSAESMAIDNNSDSDVEDTTGIDVSLLAAAEAAEAAAAAEEAFEINNMNGTHASVQCEISADEEDDEFVQRLRKWLTVMNPRQKILFRKGIYQAYIDVYDDPRNFVAQKSSEKFASSGNDIPALFTGMTPIELRLVRHLAIAVAGHKPLGSPSNTPANTIIGNQVDIKCSSDAASASSTTTNSSAVKPLPTAAAIQRSMVANNAAANGVVRTTAIAISNPGIRNGSMQRVLRKVVRVSNSGNPSATSPVAVTNASNLTASAVAQRNQNILRSRINSSNPSNPITTNSDKQRIFRILPHGSVDRQRPNINNSNFNQRNASPAPTSSPKTPNSSSSVNRAIPTSTATIATAVASPSRQPSTSATSTTGNMAAPSSQIADMKSNSNARRTIVAAANSTGADNRTHISRRYSICGSGPNDVLSTTRKGDVVISTRRSGSGAPPIPMVNINGTAVRYHQSPTTTAVRGVNMPPKFIVSGPPVNLQHQQQLKSKNPNNNQHIQQQLPSQQSLASATLNQDSKNHSSDGKKVQSNCIITSDAFEDFVIKNEPLDVED